MSSRHPVCHRTSTVCCLPLQKPVIVCSIWFHDASALCFTSLAFTSAGNTHCPWHQDVSTSRHVFLATTKAYCRQGFWHGCCCPLLSISSNHSHLQWDASSHLTSVLRAGSSYNHELYPLLILIFNMSINMSPIHV